MNNLILNNILETNENFKINKKEFISVSKIIDNISNKFDKEKQSLKCFEKYFNDINSKYYQMTQEQILEQWEEKSKIGKLNGSMLDEFIDFYIKTIYNDTGKTIHLMEIENFLSNKVYYDNKNLFNKCLSFIKFYETYILKNNIQFIGNELWMIDNIHKVRGRLDALFSYKNELLVIDWKQTENITTDNKWDNLLGPMSIYSDCDLNKYTIQVYMYKFILKNIYKFNNNIETRIIQLLDNSYKIYKPIIEYNDNMIIDIIDYVKNKIAITNNGNND